MEGPFGKRFEREVRERWRVKEAIALNSCTTALQIALQYLGADGTEVLLSTNSYVAAGNAVTYAGGMPAFCDLAPGRLSSGPQQLEERLTAKTAGVIHTHIAGIVDPEFEGVVDLCRAKGLFLIEDCAHAPGAKVRDTFVGTRSDAGCFSFYPTKILTTGTGGLLTTNDRGLAEYARSVRMHGRSEHPYIFDKPGNDWFMNEIVAVLAVHQICRLEAFIEHRQRVAQLYKSLLQGFRHVSFVQEGEGRSVYYKLPVTVESAERLRELAEFFDEELLLECEPLYYPPCHMQPVFTQNPDVRIQPCPVAEDMLARGFCLPLHGRFEREEVEQVVKTLTKFFEGDSGVGQ
jgi:dTDP-4-amino-4,6-dideoxygalactose transaminase